MYACFDCGNLDKNRKENSSNGTGHYNYGCNAQGRKYTCGWVSKDSELKTQGCSDWKQKQEVHPKTQQISMFDMEWSE